jgi:hypothetical protein
MVYSSLFRTRVAVINIQPMNYCSSFAVYMDNLLKLTPLQLKLPQRTKDTSQIEFG